METRRLTIDSEAPLTLGFLIPLDQRHPDTLQLSEYLSIGREPGNNLVLTDPFVSARHARIDRRSNGYVLRDHQSRNGTYINGIRVTEAQLSLNDQIRFGETVFLFAEAPEVGPSLTSRNSAWDKQLKRLPAFAATDFAVLISGPSGTGKELLAKAVHQHSARRNGPYISINCSALSESLIESELFGHVKGSFTGAVYDRKGAFEAARGGTLFLDEIGDLPLSLQPKLLRALENREIRPVGADRAVQTDARIIAATHKNLTQEVSAGRFREDLFYRLNVCQLQPPSLRERIEDFDHLFYSFARDFRVRFSFDAIHRLRLHSWPGNIRELKNVVARAAAYMPGEYIQTQHIEQLLDKSFLPPSALQSSLAHFSFEGNGRSSYSNTQPISADLVASLTSTTTGPNVLKEIEREMIIQRLLVNRGNQRRTAADLGIPKSTLHDRIRSYRIDIENLRAHLKT